MPCFWKGCLAALPSNLNEVSYGLSKTPKVLLLLVQLCPHFFGDCPQTGCRRNVVGNWSHKLIQIL